MSSGDHLITLRTPRFRAQISTLGASLRRFDELQGGAYNEVAWGYDGGIESKKGGQGDVLMPFPSRVKNGRYSFSGLSHQMDISDKEGPHAIHGFVRSLEWAATPIFGEGGVRLRAQLRAGQFKGYPFDLGLLVEYRLVESGLTCRFEAVNIGSEPAPFGAGFHPYFKVGTGTIDHAEARIPARKMVRFQNLIPTGELDDVAGSPADFREWRRIGETRFNQCYADLIADADGVTRAGLRDPSTGRTITVWSRAPHRYLVVYSGDAIPAPDARRAFAIEPMTCATDAFNHPEWGLEILQPGARLAGEYGVDVSLPGGEEALRLRARVAPVASSQPPL